MNIHFPIFILRLFFEKEIPTQIKKEISLKNNFLTIPLNFFFYHVCCEHRKKRMRIDSFFLTAIRFFCKRNILIRNCSAFFTHHLHLTQKPDGIGEDKRIDAHSLFSMFTATIIKEKIEWFR